MKGASTHHRRTSSNDSILLLGLKLLNILPDENLGSSNSNVPDMQQENGVPLLTSFDLSSSDDDDYVYSDDDESSDENDHDKMKTMMRASSALCTAASEEGNVHSSIPSTISTTGTTTMSAAKKRKVLRKRKTKSDNQDISKLFLPDDLKNNQQVLRGHHVVQGEQQKETIERSRPIVWVGY